jgi:hypothetical protein
MAAQLAPLDQRSFNLANDDPGAFAQAGFDTMRGAPKAPTFEDLYTQLGPSALSGISTEASPYTTGALDILNNQLKSGGLDATSKYQIEQTIDPLRQSANAATQTYLSNLGGRGVTGNGLATMAGLNTDSTAANTANLTGLGISSSALERTRNLANNVAGLGMNVQGQKFQEGATGATAADAIARSNAANRMQAQTGAYQMGNQYTQQQAGNYANAGNYQQNRFTAGVNDVGAVLGAGSKVAAMATNPAGRGGYGLS